MIVWNQEQMSATEMKKTQMIKRMDDDVIHRNIQVKRAKKRIDDMRTHG